MELLSRSSQFLEKAGRHWRLGLTTVNRKLALEVADVFFNG